MRRLDVMTFFFFPASVKLTSSSPHWVIGLSALTHPWSGGVDTLCNHFFIGMSLLWEPNKSCFQTWSPKNVPTIGAGLSPEFAFHTWSRSFSTQTCMFLFTAHWPLSPKALLTSSWVSYTLSEKLRRESGGSRSESCVLTYSPSGQCLEITGTCLKAAWENWMKEKNNEYTTCSNVEFGVTSAVLSSVIDHKKGKMLTHLLQESIAYCNWTSVGVWKGSRGSESCM